MLQPSVVTRVCQKTEHSRTAMTRIIQRRRNIPKTAWSRNRAISENSRPTTAWKLWVLTVSIWCSSMISLEGSVKKFAFLHSYFDTAVFLRDPFQTFQVWNLPGPTRVQPVGPSPTFPSYSHSLVVRPTNVCYFLVSKSVIMVKTTNNLIM